MADTDQVLRDVLVRLDALEHENHILRATVVTLEGMDHSTPPTPPASVPSMDTALNRRQVLRRAAQVTAATVAASVLVRNDERRTQASHTTAFIDARTISAHLVLGQSETGQLGVYGYTESDSNSGVRGENHGTGAGVSGSSRAGRGVYGVGVYGVHGFTRDGDIGVYGENIGTGPGVVGDGKGVEHAGVMGRNSVGDGVRGEGKLGVHGKSTTSGGYGGLFEGGKAQLRLVPKSTAGKPTTGAHSKGELLLDSVATLWICTVAGTPGTWRKVSTTVN